MDKDFEILPHTADIKIRVYGKTIEELFRHAVIGMFQIIKPRIEHCRIEGERIICDNLPITRNVTLTAPDYEILLVDFLSRALYFSDVYNEAYLDAQINELSNTTLNAVLHGIKVTGFEVVEIKAVTYHELAITHDKNGWQTDIVFDI